MSLSLRTRLILSHILPLAIIIPLMGVAIAYVMETRFLLPSVFAGLSKDATLMAEITGDQPLFWQNRALAQALVDGVEPHLSGQIFIVALDGSVLAGTELSGQLEQAHVIELPDLSGVQRGQVVQIRQGLVAEAYAPAFDSSGRAAGVIRMSTRVVSVSDQIYQLRYLLAAILLLGVLAGSALGSYLALQISRPIQRVTGSIRALAEGDWHAHVAEQGGPEEMRSLARAVNTLVDRLGSLEKARRQLLANLVHELGRPLGAMRSAIQALLRGADKDRKLAGELLHGLDDETTRLQRLLNDLAGLHDQVLGSLEMQRAQVDPGKWLQAQLPAWESSARLKGLSWEVELAPGLPPINMDGDRMAQALGNLLSNAIKFTPAGGRVLTQAWADERRFCVQITDSGTGIPAEERQHIFEPFFRGSQGRRIVEGMGLGLSIAREIARAHGGDLELGTQAGPGTTFLLWIPRGA